MIQALPSTGFMPPPVPGAHVEPPAGDLFAWLLAGHLALPEAALPVSALPATAERELSCKEDPAQEVTRRALSPAVRLPQLPAEPWQKPAARAAWPLSDPGSVEPYIPVEPFVATDSPRLESAQPAMRTIEAWVDAGQLANASRVDLSTELRLVHTPAGRTPQPHASGKSLPRNLSFEFPVAQAGRPEPPAPTAQLPVPVAAQATARQAGVSAEYPERHADVDRGELPARHEQRFLSAPDTKVPVPRGRLGRSALPPCELRSQDSQTLMPGHAHENRSVKPLAFARQHNRPDAFEPRPTSSDPHAAGDVKVDVAEPEPYLPQAVSNPDPGLELLTAPGEEAESPTVRFVLEDWNPHTPVRSIRISLEPRELGALRITLLHRGGQVHARMVVENTQALQVVQAQAQALQAALSEQGLVFGTFSVTAAANATWAGLPAASALRPDRGDPEKRRDAEPEPSTRTEVKTT